MTFIKEFKHFLAQGNVINLAVAVIIGAAFGSIVSSLVDDIITPLLLTPALHAANVNDIASLSWGAVKYGSFLSAVIKFIIISIILFALIKTMKTFLKNETETTAKLSISEEALIEIRDLLKSKN